jgi:TPR repeat protein
LAHGVGVRENWEAATEYFKKAADQGHLNAMYRLGMSYLEGKGVPHDQLQARKWLKTSADGGNPQARAALQNLSMSG